ncbi:ParB/RepB/Spo0J family partition protein [Variovorax fucosicus]|uniref:ParB/RepB/Spo0J family partition protein n=1 Tax=Variovorax fucosicus TaxID=3053517 RepID=UPI0025779622|nr:ParB/RepB/Spo0J family partition protein [Variovorax sp. J22G47]MDM0058980.1 ParB/RepB/Spo0J family partition protein [Variovorax sp. J22G47]
MNALDGLDLSGLAQFRASELLTASESASDAGKPLQVALSVIDFDLAQPRRSLDAASIAELAASIETHGVLEPVSLRTHPEVAGRYIVNRGERRVRAARHAGLADLPAFLDERIDPYAQAVENLHRENMSPFDLATFIAEREKEGHTRAEIGRRLNKPRSFITEAACLIDAPKEIRQAFEAGRLGADARALYRLALAAKKQPAQAAALLAGDAVITRSSQERVLGEHPDKSGARALPDGTDMKSERAPSAGRTVLVVEHAGRRGALRLKAHDSDVAEVRFGDGSRDLVNLKELRLVCWATEE